MSRWLAVGLVLVALAGGGGAAYYRWSDLGAPPTRSSEAEAFVLAADTDIERPLAGDASHVYRAALEAGHALHVVVTQHEVDVTLTLLDPRGENLLEVDGLNGPDGPEALAVVADVEGEYLLEVTAPPSAAGRYRLQVESLGPADELDRARAAAMKLYARAQARRRARTAESLRDALGDYRKALEQFGRAGEALLEARTRLRIGQLLLDQGSPEEALSHLEPALDLYRDHGNDWERIPCYNSAGKAYRQIGELERARQLYEQAIAAARPLGRDSAIAVAVNNLGVVHASLGEMQRALAAYDRALRQWRQLGNLAKQATVLHNLGNLYVSLGRLEEGLDFLSRAQVVFHGTGNRDGEAGTLTDIGWGHRLQGDSAAAFAAYDDALRLYRATGNVQGESYVFDQRGTVYFQTGRYSEALDSYHQALELVGSNRLDEAFTHLNLGDVYLAMERPEAAIEPLRQALQVFRRTATLTGQAATLAAVARVERRQGRLTAAGQNLQEALEIIESVRGRLQSRGFRTSYLAVQQDEYRAYIDLLMEQDARQPGRGHAARAFEVSERARARDLLESLSEARAGLRASVAPELLDRERLLRAKINLAESRRMELLVEGLEARATALERKLRSLLLEYEKVQGEISAAGTHSLRQIRPLSLAEIQREVLDDDTLLLAYSLGEKRSFLWVVDRDSLTSHVLAPRAEIDQLARQVHQLLPRSHARGSRRQAALHVAKLSEAVLGPTAERLNGRRLLILADGALHYVPFAALLVPQAAPGQGKILVADHEIVYLPSASVLVLLRGELTGRQPAPGLLAVVADPVFQEDDPRLAQGGHAAETGSGPADDLGWPVDLERASRDFGTRFERLPFAGVEARAILGLTTEAESFRATGLEASRELVLGGGLDRYRIVHFATHGLINTLHPALSGIVLSLVDEAGKPREGLLRSHEIFDLPLSADLVVLSGCRTALGKEVRGEGLIGLTHGFFYAGAARLVVSFWNVNDRATAVLMERFYRGMLSDRLPPARALREAQLSMLDETEWQAPYYWAGFALHGEWQ